MRNSVIVFLASVIGGVISAWVTAWVDQRYRAPGVSFPGDPVASFPAASTLKAGAVASVCAWGSVLAVVGSLVLSSILSVRLTIVLAVPVGLLAAYLAVFIWVALRGRASTRPIFRGLWTGAYGTTFFIDPKERLIAIWMMQRPNLPASAYFWRRMRTLAYTAIK